MVHCKNKEDMPRKAFFDMRWLYNGELIIAKVLYIRECAANYKIYWWADEDNI